MMKGALKSIAALALIVAAVLLARLATQAGTIGAGYAAKQICSGVFVARLPEQFVVSTDVLPRLATVGPLAELLGYEVNHSQREVVARARQPERRRGAALPFSEPKSARSNLGGISVRERRSDPEPIAAVDVP